MSRIFCGGPTVSKGGPMRMGAVLTRLRKGPPRPVGAGGGAIDFRIELMPCHLFLPWSPPLVAFGADNGRCSMWMEQQATAALRAVVALAGGWAGGGLRPAFP